MNQDDELKADRDDWKARALKAEQVGDRAVPDAEDYDLIDRYLRNNLDDADYGEYLAALDRLVTPQPAAQEQTSAVPVVRQMVEALERKLPGGKQTDDFESSRIGDYNQGWNDYRKAVKKMFKNINMNSSENSNPDAYLYSLEYGEKVVDTKVSIHQLNYPFGVAGADYLVRNDHGVSYVRQTKLYATLCRADLVAEVERLEQWHAEMADNRNAIASERDTLKAENAALKQAHEINADTLNAMQVEIDDWKARAIEAAHGIGGAL